MQSLRARYVHLQRLIIRKYLFSRKIHTAFGIFDSNISIKHREIKIVFMPGRVNVSTFTPATARLYLAKILSINKHLIIRI